MTPACVGSFSQVPGTSNFQHSVGDPSRQTAFDFPDSGDQNSGDIRPERCPTTERSGPRSIANTVVAAAALSSLLRLADCLCLH